MDGKARRARSAAGELPPAPALPADVLAKTAAKYEEAARMLMG